jgi:hypothetical protein
MRTRAGLQYTIPELREEDGRTMCVVQFETPAAFEPPVRDAILDRLAAFANGKYLGAAFAGPFDLAVQSGGAEGVAAAISSLHAAAISRDVLSGSVVGGATPQETEENMLAAMRAGARLIACGPLLSDLSYYGADAVAEPFRRAAARWAAEAAGVTRDK